MPTLNEISPFFLPYSVRELNEGRRLVDCEHFQELCAMPHADAFDAEASFYAAVGMGLIDLDGNMLCDCTKDYEYE